MTRKNESEEEGRIIDLPVSGAVIILKPDKYGSVAGLNNSELADPDELDYLYDEGWMRRQLEADIHGTSR